MSELPKRKGPMPQVAQVVCAECKALFQTARGELERRGRKFCSAKCQTESLRKKCPNADELRDQYVVQRISASSLSDIYGVSDVTIVKWLRDAGIEPRTMGQAVSIAQTGVQHSPEWNKAISDAHIARGSWQGKDHPNFRNPDKWRSHRVSKSGRRADLGGLYVRSSWEANFARLLNLFIKYGKVIEWKFEPEHFRFEKIKRGTTFYTPDFRVLYAGDTAPTYVEIKGYMDQVSRTKITRFRKYFPQHKLEVVDAKAYRALERQFGRTIPGWE